MACGPSREEWVRGLPWAFGVGRYERKRLHWTSERSVRYGFLIGDSVRNHPNPHLYQTGSETSVKAPRASRFSIIQGTSSPASEITSSTVFIGSGFSPSDLFSPNSVCV